MPVSSSRLLRLAPEKKPILPKTFCEFFAGIGLVRDGLERDGWRCIYANDIDSKKVQSYTARFGASDIHECDVHHTQEVINRIPLAPFLATASFPCIDLSVAGHYRGFEESHSSTLFGFTDVLNCLEDRRPKTILLENVTGFLTSRNGKDFRTATQTLADLGYWLDCFIVNASSFTPQSRPRVFVIGIESSLASTVLHNTPKNGLWNRHEAGPLRPARLIRHIEQSDITTGWIQLDLPPMPKRVLTLLDVIDVDDDQDWWDEGEVLRHYEIMSDRHRLTIDDRIASSQTWVGTIFRRVRNGKTRAEVRSDGLAGCLRTPKGGSAKQIVVAIVNQKLKMRWMSPLEYARLQGAEGFPQVGTQIQQLWGFGDAVCVPAIQWIAKNVLSPIYDLATLK